MLTYKYCTECGSPLKHNGEFPSCPSCGTVHYTNPKPTASIVPVKNGKALLAVRAIEPFKGELDLIGGFMKIKENPMEAVKREVLEETNLEVEVTDLLGIYPDVYGNEGSELLNIIYEGKVTGGKMKASDDVSELKWIPISEIPTLPFESLNIAISKLKEKYEY